MGDTIICTVVKLKDFVIEGLSADLDTDAEDQLSVHNGLFESGIQNPEVSLA